MALLGLVVPACSSAQTVEQIRIDSMLKVLERSKEDTHKVKLLNTISFTYFTVDPDEGISRGKESMELATRMKWQKGMAGACHALGANYWAKHDFAEAQNYYWKNLKLNEQLNDKTGIGKSYHDLAMTFENQYNYPKALEYYNRSLGIYRETGDMFSELGCLANIANVFLVQNDYESALKYFHQSLDLCYDYGNERHIAYMQGRIGAIHTLKKEYNTALEYLNKSLNTLEKYPDKIDVAKVVGDIGEIYHKQKDYPRALDYSNKALRISESVSSNRARGLEGKYHCNLGNIYINMLLDTEWNSTNPKLSKKSNISNAISHLTKSIILCNAVGDKEGLRDAYESLSTVQRLQGNAAASLENYKKHILYKDSLNNFEIEKEMVRHELEYAYNKSKDSLSFQNLSQQARLNQLVQEKEIAKLNLRQQWLYSIIALSILSLLASFFLYRYRTQQLEFKNQLIKEKSETKIKEAELQRKINDITFSAIRSQMNPHFIFNTLNTIQSYVYSNDKKSASNYLGKFSELIRQILDNSNRQTISLEEEVHVLQLYLDIERARFGESFHAIIETDFDLFSKDILIPPMLIQPYVENAIKHGLLHLQGEKKLFIKITESADKDYINIIIDDNGIGREKSREINKIRSPHVSFANGANERRIDLINQLLDKKTLLSIVDKKNADGTASGTTVNISIPIVSTVSAV